MSNIEISTQKSAITHAITFPACWSARQRVPAVSGEAAASGGEERCRPRCLNGRRRPAPAKYVANRLLLRPYFATLADMLGRIAGLTVIVSAMALIVLWYATTLGPILPGHP